MKTREFMFLTLVVTVVCAAHVDAFSPSRGARRVSVAGMSMEGKVNGDSIPIVDNIDLTTQLDPDAIMPLAPPLTFDKYLTMQDKRVVVTIQYSAESGMKPYFLTVAKKIKASHPDVILEKRILPAPNEGGEPTFEVVVDDKVVVGKNNARMQRLGSDKIIQDSTGGMSVFVSMGELDLAISKARRRRRPTTMYGKENESNIRDMLRRDVNDGDEEH
ncbi:hypothetical protein MHU86_16798 [Fragilaria crotonensis]|nr:hypothetical protein MHU86_16798 [Fragilaria crotonensis]